MASSTAVGRYNSSPSAFLRDTGAFLAKPGLQLHSAVTQKPLAGAAALCCSASACTTLFHFPFGPRHDELPFCVTFTLMGARGSDFIHAQRGIGRESGGTSV